MNSTAKILKQVQDDKIGEPSPSYLHNANKPPLQGEEFKKDGGEFKNDWISAVAGNSVDVDAGIASVQGDYNFCFAFWVNRGYYVVLDSGTHPVSKAATPPKRGIK